MDNNNPQPIELDIKDIFLFILKKTHIVLLGGILIAALAGGYGYFESLKASADEASKTNVLDLDSRLSGESDEEYEQRVLLVGRAENIKANIETLNSQNDDLRNYISDSLLMQLDPMNVSVSKAQFIIEVDDTESYGMVSALIDSYANAVETGDYINDIAQEYGYTQGALQELIRAGNDDISIDSNSEVVFKDGDVTSMVLTIEIWGDSPELTEAIMDGALSAVNEKYSEFNSSIAKHTITEIGRQNYVSFVSDVRDLQLDTMSTYQTLNSQIDSGNKSLDDIAKQLGLTDRNDFYASASKSTSASTSKSSPIKNAVIGFILGAVLTFAFFICKYIFGRKLLSQTQFFCLFPGNRNIGVVKPSSKRSKMLAAIDRASGDDCELPDDKAFALITANCKNLTKDMSRVLITGTVDDENSKKIAEGLGVPCDVKLDVFNNPDILNVLGDYDGVIVIEQRGVSEKKRISKELELLNNGAKTVVGIIIV